MKFKYLFYIFLIIHLSYEFDVNDWTEKFCYDEFHDFMMVKNNMFCERSNFTKQDLKDIQSEDFVISNKKHIYFRFANIGVFNDNFLRKFPNIKDITFQVSTLELGESTQSNQIHSIRFWVCQISGTKNSNIFQKFDNLEKIYFEGNVFDSNILKNNLMGNIPNLKELILIDNSFLKISSDAFRGSNIEKLHISSMTPLPLDFLFGMKSLKMLNLHNLDLTEIPCKVIPENIESLSFRNNSIDNPNFKDCKFKKSLKYISLFQNKIKNLGEDTFKELQNVEKINLAYNRLTNFSKTYILSLKKLKYVILYGNYFDEENIDLGNIKLYD